MDSNEAATCTTSWLVDRVLELEEENYRLRRAIETDSLTSIRNELGLAAAVADRAGWYIYVDLNGFKAINDKHGHEAGDAVLREFAEFLRSNTRQAPSDKWNARKCDSVASRMHGDEFVVWTETNLGAHRIRRAIKKWRSTRFTEASASAGIGRTIVDADAAMFVDKHLKPKTTAEDSSR